ncbi:hypothetical protein H8356DRAFT_1423476 [Neocallimastix lanati (nom. inval.)]|nr:hypothetical protein H8356DRAFT_1423476 [Neocallimastix sp. JGI-2020a]
MFYTVTKFPVFSVLSWWLVLWTNTHKVSGSTPVSFPTNKNDVCSPGKCLCREYLNSERTNVVVPPSIIVQEINDKKKKGSNQQHNCMSDKFKG